MNEEITRIEVYTRENKEPIKIFDNASFIEKLMTKLNNATAEKISDTSEIAIPPYKVKFKNKEKSLIELGFHQTENGAYYLDSDNQVRYTINMPLPDVPLETNSMTEEEIEKLNKKERKLEENFRSN